MKDYIVWCRQPHSSRWDYDYFDTYEEALNEGKRREEKYGEEYVVTLFVSSNNTEKKTN